MRVFVLVSFLLLLGALLLLLLVRQLYLFTSQNPLLHDEFAVGQNEVFGLHVYVH